MATINADSLQAAEKTYAAVNAPVSSDGQSPRHLADRLAMIASRYKEETDDYRLLIGASNCIDRLVAEATNQSYELSRALDKNTRLVQHLQTIKFVVNA